MAWVDTQTNVSGCYVTTQPREQSICDAIRKVLLYGNAGCIAPVPMFPGLSCERLAIITVPCCDTKFANKRPHTNNGARN